MDFKIHRQRWWEKNIKFHGFLLTCQVIWTLLHFVIFSTHVTMGTSCGTDNTASAAESTKYKGLCKPWKCWDSGTAHIWIRPLISFPRPWNAFTTLTRRTGLHSCMRKLCHIGQISNSSQAILPHLVASLDESPRSPLGGARHTSLKHWSQGQTTAVGASDCKTLMNVRRLKPTSHLAG